MKKRGKPSFDAVVKFFMQSYEIPTKKDIDRITRQLDRLERLLKSSQGRGGARLDRDAEGNLGIAASDHVLGCIRRSKTGLGISDIKTKTGFDDKKIRNIIFRLNKLGKIKRINRGVYGAAD